MPIHRLRMPAGVDVNIQILSGNYWNMVNQKPVYCSQKKKFLEYIEDPENDRLAPFRGDFKRLK